MHYRAGLKTEYLGEEWFDYINACTDEARDWGLRHRSMMRTYGLAVCAFSCTLKKESFFKYNRICKEEKSYKGNTDVIYFEAGKQTPTSFYNGYIYLDTFNIDETNCFLTCTHEKIQRYCIVKQLASAGRQMGKKYLLSELY